MVESSHSRQSIWNSLIAYGLIKTVGWLRRGSQVPVVSREQGQTASASRPAGVAETEHGLLGWWALFRDAALRWIERLLAWALRWPITRFFLSAR
jgi:hypothetical protein